MRIRGFWPLAVILFPSVLAAAANPGRGTAAFLRIPAGARAGALGESFVAAAEGAQSFLWNPAGLAPLSTPELRTDHLSYFDQTRVDTLVFVYPTPWGGIGAGTRWFTGPSLARFRDGLELGSFHAVERTGEAAFAFGKRSFSLGVLGRYYSSNLGTGSAATAMADVGALKTWRKGRYRLGASAQNLGPSVAFGSGEDAAGSPALLRAGIALKESAWMLSYEHQKPRNLQGRHHAGVELWAMSSLALRFGYIHSPRGERSVQDALTPWRFGAGVRVKSFDVDYALAPEHALGDAHHVSLSYRFSGMTLLEEKGRVTFEAAPAAFSPNADGRADATFLILGTQGVENISRYQLEVRDAQGFPVWRKAGRGAPPGLTEWAGLTDKGEAAGEGDYTLQARVWSPRARAVSASRRVVIDLTPPEASLEISTAVFTPDGDGVEDAIDFSLTARDNAELSRWTAEISPPDAPDLAVHAASGVFQAGLSTFSWNGLSMRTGETAANGSYVARISVFDLAENELPLTSAAFEVALSTETILKNLPPDLKVVKTPEGYQITLLSRHLFGDPRGSEISPQAKVLLTQLLVLAKAFPKHNLFINGFVGSEKQQTKRVELSSAQAWALYSALVKAGVPATRLEVHGQGGNWKEPNRLEIYFILVEP